MWLASASPEIGGNAPFYEDKRHLLFFMDASGAKHPITNIEEWSIRRQHVLFNFQLVSGPLPGSDRRVPLDLRIEEEIALPKYVRKKISFAVEAGD